MASGSRMKTVERIRREISVQRLAEARAASSCGAWART